MTSKYDNEETLHKKIFTAIYEEEKLGSDGSTYYKGSSGSGSTYEYNKNEYLPFLKKFVIDKQIKSIVDIGCGNARYMMKLYDELALDKYIGYDVYNKIQTFNTRFTNNKKYNFIVMDVLVHLTELEGADLCIIKDVFQHWELADIMKFLLYVTKNKVYKYILVINCCDQRYSIYDNGVFKTGEWRQLNSLFYPLKSFGFSRQLLYNTKEVSLWTA